MNGCEATVTIGGHTYSCKSDAGHDQYPGYGGEHLHTTEIPGEATDHEGYFVDTLGEFRWEV